MDYITPKDAAEKWGIGIRRVQYFCSHDKIPGAMRMGRQWFIPATAARPLDGRSRSVTESIDLEPYHFPLLMFTKHFASDAELSEDERQLLRAQLVSMQGHYLKSIKLALKIIKTTHVSSVKFGAYFIAEYGFNMLGLYEEMLASRESMRIICKNNPAHEEDYQLIIAACLFQSSHDIEALQSIDTGKLSDDALMYYEYVMLQVAVINSESESRFARCVYDSLCKRLKILGILPALVAMEGCLAAMHAQAGDFEQERIHIQEACRIGVEGHYFAPLAKCFYLAPSKYAEELAQYGTSYVDELDELHKQNLRSWMLIFHTSHGTSYVNGLTTQENNLLLLVYYRTKPNLIANITGVKKSQIPLLIKSLCEKLGLSSKAELIEFAKSVFDAPAFTKPALPD